VELFILVIALLAAGLAVAIGLARRTPEAAVASQLSVVGERLANVADRLALLENRQDGMRDGLSRLDTSLAHTSTLASGLRDATEAIRGDLARAGESVAALESAARARHARDDEAMRSLQRLEQVIAGTAAKGAAGENIIDLVFSRLPAEWQLRDFRIGNRVVEFALRLPGGLALPIDSKWPATSAIEALAASTDPAERARLKAQVEATVLDKAREVRKYLDPELTAGFAIAVVPDAVDELCGALKAECLRMNVALVGYSLFLPYLLLVFQVALRAGPQVDLARLAAHLDAAAGHAAALHDEVEGRLSRALVMLTNSRDDLRAHVGRIALGLAAVRAPEPSLAPALSPLDGAVDEGTGSVAAAHVSIRNTGWSAGSGSFEK
jgi:DNA recombination protein RmuC